MFTYGHVWYLKVICGEWNIIPRHSHKLVFIIYGWVWLAGWRAAPHPVHLFPGPRRVIVMIYIISAVHYVALLLLLLWLSSCQLCRSVRKLRLVIYLFIPPAALYYWQSQYVVAIKVEYIGGRNVIRALHLPVINMYKHVSGGRKCRINSKFVINHKHVLILATSPVSDSVERTRTLLRYLRFFPELDTQREYNSISEFQCQSHPIPSHPHKKTMTFGCGNEFS